MQGIEVPPLARAVSLGLQNRRLAAQFAFEIEVGAEAQSLILHLAFALQRPGQGARQFRDPIRRVERRQIQRGIPGDAVGEAHIHVPFGPALPGLHDQLRQGDLFEAAAEWTAQRERTGRAIQRSVEIAEVLAVGVGHFASESTQRHLRLVDLGIEPVPREVLPVDIGLGAEAFAPVDIAGELEALLLGGVEIEPGDLRAAGVDLAFEQQRHWRFFRGQRGIAEQLITVFQVAFAREHQLIELQRVRQIGARFERVAGDAHLGRQVFRECLQLAAQLAIQVATTVGVQVEGFQQVAVDFQRQRPRLAARSGQSQIALNFQRPVAARLQQAGQVQAELVALQFHAVDLQTLSGPVRRQLQALELFAAVEQQATDLDIAQLNGQRQLQIGQFDRAALGDFFARRELQDHLIGLELIDAQGHARQAQRRPGEDRPVQLDAACVLLPHQMIGAPLASEATVEILHAQAGYKAQRPTAAGLRAKQCGQAQDDQHYQRQQRQRRYFHTTLHSSGPMEKCSRMPPSSSSA